MKLNDSQQKAVQHGKGPMIVLAGPGSGKTMVITHRVRHLIREAGVDPSQILVVTFTRAAADEMRQRFLSLMQGERLPVSFGTFHAVFFTILKHSFGYSAANIVQEADKARLLRGIVEEMPVGGENMGERTLELLEEIARVKGNLYDIDHYYAVSCGSDDFRRIYRAYNKALEQERLIDFEDMMLQTLRLFRGRREILDAWRKKFRYILVDEFQDISPLQYRLVRMLAVPENNLFIVGDDDQSIYSFRGARPEIMLHFGRDYPGARQVVLGVNYRSRREIVRASQALICHNKQRFPKRIESACGAGQPVQICLVKNPAEEGKRILSLVQDFHEKGVSYAGMAVLLRTAAQARPFLESLVSAGIPFQVQDTVPDLYQHWIVQDVMTYLKIAAGSCERSDYLRILNRPNRYISRQKLTGSRVDLGALAQSLKSQPWIRERVIRLEEDIALLRTMAPYAAIHYIRRGIGYDAFLEEYAGKRHLDPADLFEVLDELQEDARGVGSLGDWQARIQKVREEAARQAAADRNREDALVLETMHHAKGLEYEIVFIPDANEKITPHHKAQLEADLEEERRMFYVAMTRAREKLYIFSLKERYGKELEVSRFVREILGRRGLTP